MKTGQLSDDVREHIRRLVDEAPPLTAQQRSRLAVLLRPGTQPATAEKRAA